MQSAQPDLVEPSSVIADLLLDMGIEARRDVLLQAASGVWRGKGSEWEFAALAVWGGASLVQRIDAGHWTPDAKSRYKTPDLLVVVPDQSGNDVAFWVEVKTSSKSEVRVSKREFGRMAAFQVMTGLPYLMAYKHENKLWTLRELDTLQKVQTAYRLDLSDMKDNLMGVLLNDFMAVVPEGVGWYIVLERQDGRRADEPGDAPFKVVDTYFGDRTGTRLEWNSWMLYFLMALGPEENQEFSETQVVLSFTSPGADWGVWGHTVFEARAWLHQRQGDAIPWGAVLRKARDLPSALQIEQELRAQGFLSRVIRQQPQQVSEALRDIV